MIDVSGWYLLEPAYEFCLNAVTRDLYSFTVDEALYGLLRVSTGETVFPADTVIYAVGQRPLWEEAAALRGVVPEFHQIGDCVMPKNIHEATRAAYYTARDLGRM